MVFTTKKVLRRIGIISIVAFTACNVFNPSGEGSLPESSEGKNSVGQSRLKRKDWDGAIEAFTEAIKSDSNNSLAYYGYAKAVRFKYNLNGLTLSKELTDTAGGKLPFVGSSDTTNPNAGNKTLTNYLQATVRINPILGKLVERDSLTRKNDSLLAGTISTAGKNWLNAYFAEAKNNPLGGNYAQDKFPLTDRFINYEKITPDLMLTQLIYTFINLKDLNGDTVIDTNDNVTLVNDILELFSEDLSTENLATNAQQLFEDTKGDTAKIEELNNVIDKLAEGTQDVAALADLAGSFGVDLGGSLPGGGGTTGGGDSATGVDSALCDSIGTGDCSSSEQLTGDITETIAALGNTITFYKFPDKKDNDGDGCVDEEIYDQKDNDGDGIVDEDVRGQAYGTIATDPITGLPQVDSNFNPVQVINVTVSELIDPTDTTGELVAQNALGQLTFTDSTGFWSAALNVTAKDPNHNPRFIVLNAIGEDASPPYTLDAATLQYAKDSIGGCWNAYK